MNLIIVHSIRKKEFKKGVIQKSDLDIIIKALKKEVYTSIKGRNLPDNTRLIKVYATSVSGARRIVYLIEMVTGDVFFLFFRDKNDKLGKNISINNPVFEKELNKYLRLLSVDIDNNDFEIIEL